MLRAIAMSQTRALANQIEKNLGEELLSVTSDLHGRLCPNMLYGAIQKPNKQKKKVQSVSISKLNPHELTSVVTD